jgi:hypothetical protein
MPLALTSKDVTVTVDEEGAKIIMFQLIRCLRKSVTLLLSSILTFETEILPEE